MTKIIKKFASTLPKSDRGFTLAETLITLVIVGVVAALTIPNMLVKYQKEEIVTKLKKEYSTLQQAINRSIADNGLPKTWDNSNGAEYFITTYLAPYLSYNKIYPVRNAYSKTMCYNGKKISIHYWRHGNAISSPESTDTASIELSDGTCIGYNPHNNFIFIDINGSYKKPNIAGTDYFIFKINQANGKIEPGYRDEYYCQKNTNGHSCADLIIKNGWQITYF